VSLWLLQLAVRNKNIMKVTAHGIIFARSPIVGPTTAYREKNPRLPKKDPFQFCFSPLSLGHPDDPGFTPAHCPASPS